MSFFLNQKLFGNDEVDAEKVKLAEVQFEAMSTTFNTMLKVCREKCIPHEYGESELNKGESVCVDRCVLKYMETNLKIGQYAQSVRLDAKDLNFHEYLKSKYTEKKKE